MVSDWSSFEFLGNSVFQWGIFCGIWLVFGSLIGLTKKIVVDRLDKIAHRTPTEWDDLAVGLLRSTRSLFIFGSTLYLGSLFLERSQKFAHYSRAIVVILFLVQLGIWGMQVIEFVLQRFIDKKSKENGGPDAALATTLPAIRLFASLFLYSMLALIALDNLGINVSALLAGLGVGGIAVALAAQNILGDIFASLSIVIDKPFVLGDQITVADVSGTVEKIGLKTTRLRSVTGEQLIIANADILKSRIHNYKRMDERRVTFTLSVAYETPPQKLEKIPVMIQEIFQANKIAQLDRAHLKTLGSSSLDFEVVYWVESSDYRVYMDTQQTLNFEILKRFEREQIEFAYPTQTIIVQKAERLAS